MSQKANWNVEDYKEEHESEEQWSLRKAFLERWKDDYPEDRLLCLARVFANIEFMGCRYPLEVMKEVTRLSDEVANKYRQSKKGKLQRTFVSASDAAEDRAKGIKRAGGIVSETPQKSMKINFVPQGQSTEPNETIVIEDDNNKSTTVINLESDEEVPQKVEVKNNFTDYLEEMKLRGSLDSRSFRDQMFDTCFGRLVLLARPWNSRFNNIQASCATSGVPQTATYEKGCFTLTINGAMVARATGDCKADARTIVETMAWNRLSQECVTVVVKEQFIAQGDSRITSTDVSGAAQNGGNTLESGFGTPVDSSVASKMMKLMGWSGGGLGVEAQGISEPIKPHLQQIHRAGLGSSATGTNIQEMRRSAIELMRRYSQAETLDVDLVFAADFSKEERAELHQCAKRCGLISKSYGKEADRFLVVRKKLDPFSLVRAIVQRGGTTPKYQVFIPLSFHTRGR